MKEVRAKIRKTRVNVWRETKDYATITLGMAMYSLGWTVFLLQNDLIGTGVPGIASLVYWATDHMIPVQYTYVAINGLLLVASLIVLGWKFSVKTIWAVFSMTTVLPIIQHITANVHILQDQPFMACVIGASLCGVGVGITFLANGSSGGTDIIAAIVNKYRTITLGRVMMMSDMIIVSCSYFLFHSMEKVVYGFCVLLIINYVVDQVVNSGRQSVQFFIISKYHEEIGHLINEEVHRGVTFIDGMGCYTHNEVKLMFILAKKRESTTIFRLVKDVDPDAFISQSAVIGVFGNGFDKIKTK